MQFNRLERFRAWIKAGRRENPSAIRLEGKCRLSGYVVEVHVPADASADVAARMERKLDERYGLSIRAFNWKIHPDKWEGASPTEVTWGGHLKDPTPWVPFW